MKIGVGRILRNHFRTMRDAETGRVLKRDITLFYVVPVVFSAVLVDFTSPPSTTDWSDQALTFFGIFLALLINVQVALFAILQRGRAATTNKRRGSIQKDDLELRRVLLGEMNANISYLNLICVFAIAVTLLMAIIPLSARSTVAILTVFYSHFLLTMLMVTKRAHALFQKEYGARKAAEWRRDGSRDVIEILRSEHPLTSSLLVLTGPRNPMSA